MSSPEKIDFKIPDADDSAVVAGALNFITSGMADGGDVCVSVYDTEELVIFGKEGRILAVECGVMRVGEVVTKNVIPNADGEGSRIIVKIDGPSNSPKPGEGHFLNLRSKDGVQFSLFRTAQSELASK